VTLVTRRLRDRLALSWSAMPLRRRGLVVVAIPVMPLLLTALLFVDSSTRQARAEAEVRRGLSIERDLQHLLAVLFDAESGVRGYLLTGDPTWLRSFDASQHQVPAVTARLTTSITHAEQRVRFGYARDLIDERVAVLAELRGVAAEEAAAGRRVRSPALVTRGRALMDQIRAEFSMMQQIQDGVLDERAARASRARRATLGVAGVGVGLGVVGGVVAALLFTAGVGRVERQLQESAAELDRFFSLSPDMLCIAGTDGYFKRVNAAWTKALQWSEQELLATPYLDLVHPSDVESSREQAAALAQGETTAAFENRYRARGGGYHRLEWNASAVPGSGVIYAAARDVTQQRITEGRIRVLNRELAIARDFLEELIAASPSIVFRFLPADLTFTYVSPNVGWLLGYSPAEMVGVPHFWPGLIHPDDRERVLAALADAPESLTTQIEQEYRVRGQDGRYRWFYTLMRLEYDGGDVPKPVAVLGYALDIAERKAAEEAARNARLDAERANRAKSEFLSRMSHDLRTPLNAIIGFAQLVELEASTADERDAAVQIIKGGRHLLALINEVLDVARIEAGQLTLSPEPVGVHELVTESLNLVRPLARNRDIHLETLTGSGGAPHVLADRQRLAQVLLNLLSNAVKYNRDGGRVTVAWRIVDDNVELRVSDTGPGIRPEQLSRLFTPFDRLDAGEAVEGTGLGLVLCKRLAEAMGGRMGVESYPGRGSTFWISLPTIQAPAAPADRVLPGAVRGTNGAVKGTVLYIEDNPSNLRLIERIMARRPGVTLLSAIQGGIGLELARSRRPDLIFLDLHLPDTSGAEVLHRLRAHPDTADIPVVILSADATRRQIERQLEAGARAYLTKPLDVTDLLALVDETLAARKARSGTQP